MTLPVSTEFETDCDELLSSNIISSRCKQQCNFQELCIGLATNDNVNDWSLKSYFRKKK